MRPPHHALPWPVIDPNELSRSAGDLRRLSATISSEVRIGEHRSTSWHGRSAAAQGNELDWLRSQAALVPRAASNAAVVIEQLEQMVRSAQRDIRILAESLHAAEWNARSKQTEADFATQAAAVTPGADPVSLAEAERLRHRALLARRRAVDARRQADLVLRRAIAAASDVVQTVDRQDQLTAHQLDSLLTVPLSRHERARLEWVPVNDRAWAINQIAGTRAAIQRYVGAVARAVADLETVPWSERTWWESMALVHLTERLDLHRRFLAPGRQMLAWDPTDDGRAVEVFGDLTTARHIAVVVPGIMNTIENFDDQLARDARSVWLEAAALDGRTAVIAWLGYDTPELLNAVSKSRAVEYEPELRSLVASLPADAHVTVIAHSYGTVLVGEAASRGLAADDLVLVGSPGTRLDHATDADLEPGAQVFAGVSDSDYVVGRTGYGSVVCPEKALGIGWLTGLRWVISPVTGPLSWITDSCNTDADGDVKGLSHGINPAHDDFGAIEISTEDVVGHSSYFDPEGSSLAAIAQIVTGSHPEQR